MAPLASYRTWLADISIRVFASQKNKSIYSFKIASHREGKKRTMGVNTSTEQSASQTADMIKLVQTAKSSPGSFTAI